MQISNVNIFDTKNNNNVNFKSKIPVRVFSTIKTSTKEVQKESYVDSNMASIIRKFIRVLYGNEPQYFKSNQMIEKFKNAVKDNGLENGEKIRFSVRKGIANIFTGRDAENMHDRGTVYGLASSASDGKPYLPSLEYKVAVKNEKKSPELRIYTSGQLKINKKGEKIYHFEIDDFDFNECSKERKPISQPQTLDIIKAKAKPYNKKLSNALD